MANIVAIVGRPNVGKSTLFNRLVEERKAIVDDLSGVTRDRHYGTADWIGKNFTVIDTGGFVPASEDVFEKAIRSQVKIAIEEADVLLFVVDVTTGITDLDAEFAKVLRRSKKPVFVVVNKVDNNERQYQAAEFYGLGFDNLFMISSITGSGTGELLDEMVSKFPEEEEVEEIKPLPKIAIIGRPNVGKSSYINALLGEERNIVTEIAGTTRDTIHSKYQLYGKEFFLMDTAGIRRKTKVKEDVEFYSVMRSIRAIEECDVVLLLVDATVGLDSQELNLVHLADKNGKGIVILVNKWDLITKDQSTSLKVEKEILEKLRPFNDIPVMFISVLTKQRLYQSVEMALKVYDNRARKIPTHELNDTMLPFIEH
ncbi:MAG: ribosome biogenesis GTPase Der, partial [Bacteroidia bacterium]